MGEKTDALVFELSEDREGAKTLSFNSAEEFIEWAEQEKEFWQWAQSPLRSIGAGNLWRQVLNQLLHLPDDTKRFQANPKNRSSVESRLKSIYSETRLPFSTEPFARFLTDLRGSRDDLVAAGALAARMRYSFSPGRPEK